MKHLAHILLFVASLLGTSTALREAEVLPFWGWSAQKLEVMRSQGDAYDTVFLGSSRLHYAAIPELFDARAAELGMATKSYSLCFSGTRMLDTVRILDWLIENKPQNLRQVVVELHTTSQDIRETQWMTDQEIEMHAPCVFPARMESIAFASKPIWSRVCETGYCLVHTLMCQLRIGQGSRIVTDHVDIAANGKLSRIWDVADRGWVSVDATALDHMKKFHTEFVADLLPYEAVVAGRVADPSPQWLHGDSCAEPILSVTKRLREAGIEPIFVVMPTLVWDFRGREIVSQVRSIARVLELDRPAENRPLWDMGLYYDSSHFGEQGARVFTRFLAERIAECKGLPLDKDPAARKSSESGIRFTARRSAEGSVQIELRADELPFVGQPVVIADHRRQDTALPSGFVLGMPWPAQFQQPLRRDSIYRASGAADWAGVDPTKPLFLQVGVVEGTEIVGVSSVVELPPLR